ncbi:AAA family ATPase [Kitasatospora sp. NPDC058170]|uniref:ATP-binding protein n=1 Tax=Kitasatospora sp. NPDC058170 TaxID=3346364 RepID=UPI0036D87D37
MPRRESPLDQGDGPLLRFAGDLRALRERAGTPPYRQLAVRAHCSAASLSVAAGGRRLPSLAVTLAYVQACGGDVREWQHRWQLLAAELAADTAARRRAQDAGRAPYPGAVAFEAADAERFFGREALLDRLVALLSERRLVVLVGPSGVGKSSLVRAGLLARLDGGAAGGPREGPSVGSAAGPTGGVAAGRGGGPRGGRANGGAAPVALLTPGERPMEAFALALARLGQRAGEAQRGADPVLVVDQAEELRTRCRDAAERESFLDALVASAADPGGGRGGQGPFRCRVVLVVRSDQGAALLAEHPALTAACRDAVLAVGRPAPDELRRAITEPALRSGCTVEGALLAVLISAAAQQPGALPLLSSALLETWRRRSGNALTLAGFQATGGFEGALARTAEALYGGLGAEDRERARSVFLRLSGEAAPGGGEGARKPVGRAEFDEPGVPAVLERLVRARLVVLDRGTVELAHHVLPQAWPRLRDWLAEGREVLGDQRRLTEAARIWDAADRDPELLLRGARLEQVRRRVTAGELTPAGVERAFLSAAVRTAAADRRRARRQSLAVAGLAAAGGALLTLAGGSRMRRAWRH